MQRIAILDGDVLCYQAASVNEKRSVNVTHNESLEQRTFNNITEFRAWLSSEEGFVEEDFTIKPVQEAGPVENALHILKQQIEGITNRAKCDSYHVVLSGKDNFRLDLPLPTQYKSNRKGLVHPLQLKDCQEYLIKRHDAEVSVGEEADDLIVKYAYQGHKSGDWIIACTVDKDAKHGPFRVFDWTKDDEPKLITGFGELELIVKDSGKDVKGYGRKWAYYQMVMGDIVDGFKPCQLAKVKFGAQGAYKLLKDTTNDTEALAAVVEQYRKWYPEPITYYDWKNEKHTKSWLEIMQMYADCVHMRRWDNDRLDVKNVLTKLGVEL